MTDVSWLTTGPQTQLILTAKPGLTPDAAAQALADADAAVALARRARIAEEARWVRFVERTFFVWIALFCVAAFFVCRQFGLAFWHAMWIATTLAIVVGFLLVSGVTVLARERRKKRGLPSDQRTQAEAGLNRAARSAREVDPEVAELVADLLRADRSLEGRVHDLVWRSATRPLAAGGDPSVQAQQALEDLEELYERHVGEDD